MIRVYTQQAQGQLWLRRYLGHRPRLVCVLGFTETGLIPKISAAGATPADRKITAIADAELLYHGITPSPKYPLPSLIAGVSPALISRAIISAQRIPLHLFNAGLPTPPTVPHIDLHGVPAACVR
ncbi:MAG: TIGR00303 family protein, partial [Leptolyngbya sp. SIO1D8]|nr:TIGR00303 family protein [Leptolyngbya sp. SIO1D8]